MFISPETKATIDFQSWLSAEAPRRAMHVQINIVNIAASCTCTLTSLIFSSPIQGIPDYTVRGNCSEMWCVGNVATTKSDGQNAHPQDESFFLLGPEAKV